MASGHQPESAEVRRVSGGNSPQHPREMVLRLSPATIVGHRRQGKRLKQQSISARNGNGVINQRQLQRDEIHGYTATHC
jgi:hypothetical protein